MKPKINAVIIVEGENDKSYLSNLFDCEFYVTNGFDIKGDNLIFLKELNKKIPLIILTDPDESGKLIRKRLNEILINPINVEVDINKCDKNNKHGVKECQKEELIKVLSPYFADKGITKGVLTMSDLFELGAFGSEVNNLISEKFKLGKCNSKQLLKRLNLLNVSKIDIEEVIKEHYGNK